MNTITALDAIQVIGEWHELETGRRLKEMVLLHHPKTFGERWSYPVLIPRWAWLFVMFTLGVHGVLGLVRLLG